MWYRLLRPILFLFPAEWAHRLATLWLQYRPARFIVSKSQITSSTQQVNVAGVVFPNRVGLAGGFDKNGDYIEALFSLGFGFVEVGTVTPKPQFGNPKPRLFRLTQDCAIINRMGFNNKGVDYLVEQLKQRRAAGIVGVNIGKNKDTPLELAADDYCCCLRKVYAYADYVVINISSPNTPGLRMLHGEDYLSGLLSKLTDCRKKLQLAQQRTVPLFLKISVDLSAEECASVVDAVKLFGLEGIISSNTTVSRDTLKCIKHRGEIGGLSGAPLRRRAYDQLLHLKSLVGNDVAIISVGGIMTQEEAQRRWAAGADLIQVYTGLVYQGMGLVKQLVKGYVA